jgi:hypothetical protein
MSNTRARATVARRFPLVDVISGISNTLNGKGSDWQEPPLPPDELALPTSYQGWSSFGLFTSSAMGQDK